MATIDCVCASGVKLQNPQFTFNQTKFTPESFWDRRRRVVRLSTLQAQLHMLKVTGRYDAFDLRWHPVYDQPPSVWPGPNHLFWDSDVAKWIEGACYFLEEFEDAEIQKAVEELVDKIGKAQQEDGYINLHYTVVEPGKRFTNLRDMHELYNAGHLFEAALIHEQHFKNQKLLKPIVKYVHLLHSVFGPAENQIHGYPGHPEVELSLLRLWRATSDMKALELAQYFIEERGNSKGANGRHYYDVEAENRNEDPHSRPDAYPESRAYWYQQAHKPILEQETIEGHSVRAMYLLTSVADLCLIEETIKQKYLPALHRLWRNMLDKKMYLTGGIGAMKQWEGFGLGYFLPQSTEEGGCYSETCAAIGVIMLAERLLQLELDGEYADAMELCLYNAVLTGMSLDGKAFTYDNQLGSSDDSPSRREDWFEVSCCPPNVSRLLGYLGGCLWTHKQTGPKSVEVNVHLYNSATTEVDVNGAIVKLSQRSNWPWKGDIDFELVGASDIEKTVRLRIPAWAETYELSPALSGATLEKGYITLSPTYLSANPQFRLSLPLKPRLIRPHPLTNQPIVAVARGPIVYCVEDADNTWVDDHFKSVVLDTEVPLTESETGKVVYHMNDAAETEEYVTITAKNAARFLKTDDMEGPERRTNYAVEKDRRETLKFAPYYIRANRGGQGMMRVGLRVGDFAEE
ncbi:transcription factor TFIIIB subunit brf1 [Ascosphaera pollenicola]|nr:transcription factor TFIIIB subunit brf1 [Ascosphaera pollenicola]